MLGAKISIGPWMVCSNLIKIISSLAAKVVCKMSKKGEFSPVLAVAASLDSGIGDVGSSGFRLDWCQGLAVVVMRDIQLFNWTNQNNYGAD